jgi:hypothetical protein
LAKSNKLIYSNKDKYEELIKVSNPKKVIENAIKYFNDPNIEIYLSPSKNKKYMIYDDKCTRYILDILIIPILLNIKMKKEKMLIYDVQIVLGENGEIINIVQITSRSTYYGNK